MSHENANFLFFVPRLVAALKRSFALETNFQALVRVSANITSLAHPFLSF
jgi:hypothetical protein